MMTKTETMPEGMDTLKDAEVYRHGHLPLAAAYCRQLGLVELVNRIVPSRMDVSPGLVVQAMVLDTLSGRSPLYRLEEFLADQDLELLLGESVDPHAFNDSNLGRSLDVVFDSGPWRILAELGVEASRKFDLDCSKVSYDTTSTSVWGDYRSCESDTPPDGPRIVHGHSKDNRSDLKQFMTELLCVERGVPIFGGTLDGNSSDKITNNKLLTRIASIMSRHGLAPGEFVYVADSAMVTGENLSIIGKNLFVSRLPAVFKVCGKAITEAVKTGDWIDVGRLAELSESGRRVPASYKIFETSVEIDGGKFRAVVVHSDSLDKRRRKKLNKSLERSQKELEAELKKNPVRFYCEADAIEAAGKAVALSKGLHDVVPGIREVKVGRRGRPPKNGPALTKTMYELEWKIEPNTEMIVLEEERAGCFVLITNIPAQGDTVMDGEGVLRAYKGQYGVENNFAFLKDPLVANDIFLKTPSRIDVLGMVLVISLLIWRLMERSLRAYVANSKEDLPGWENRRTKRPTTFMVFTSMFGIIVMKMANGNRFLIRPPRKKPGEYLKALGLDTSIFINPQSKCTPIIPKKTR